MGLPDTERDPDLHEGDIQGISLHFQIARSKKVLVPRIECKAFFIKNEFSA
jgi:hypothetical protein